MKFTSKKYKITGRKISFIKKISTYKAIKCSDQPCNIYLLPKETPLTG